MTRINKIIHVVVDGWEVRMKDFYKRVIVSAQKALKEKMNGVDYIVDYQEKDTIMAEGSNRQVLLLVAIKPKGYRLDRTTKKGSFIKGEEYEDHHLHGSCVICDHPKNYGLSLTDVLLELD